MVDVAWMEITDSVGPLAPDIRVFSGTDPDAPLRVWYARVPLSGKEVSVHVATASDIDGRETTSDLSEDYGACIAVNGGYFRMDLNPSLPVGLLISDGRFVSPATPGVFRDDLRYPIARATLGFFADGKADITWTASRHDSVFSLVLPPDHRPGKPAPALELSLADFWPVTDAVSGGPALLANGVKHITVNEEVFFGTTIPDRHPRTAAGLTDTGDLILMVVDGRQGRSRGVDLDELASLMQTAGASDALNLDGGGSSAFVVNGRLLNQPVGGSRQREVVSAIVVECPGG